MDDKKTVLIEKMKNVIIEMVHYTDELPKINYSDHISEKLGFDYTHISKIFSEIKGITIEQFIIAHKIERVKELLLYGELNLLKYLIYSIIVAYPIYPDSLKRLPDLHQVFSNSLKIKKEPLSKTSELCNIFRLLYNNYHI